ncbi:flagellar hook-associated protein FlgK [Ferrimonas sediminicola]|uniref:Flagellar hook-associated protein 1 n=1 Tax=Ferrimonas sediminicola TaxID=2569538 RepID=A0A4U1BAS6_9GAMM|nr:flagellar hook-associated protein FlgK [Ferrimonas sediminicola]TKB47800.1 flagellar hook-associated protein FlgK [Ferrimonas sediminicola]
MTTMLNTGLSGLLASQAALSVTSNNIANATVAGYSRQQVMLSTVQGGVYGRGVAVEGVRRIADQYLVDQVWSTTTSASFQQTQSSYLGQVEQIFGSEGSNISSGLDKLFAALNSNLLSPGDLATRQSVVNEAKGLSLRFNAINDGLQSQFDQLESQLRASVEQSNVRLHEVARLNAEVKGHGGIAAAPPELIDERDAVIAELAKQMDLTVSENHDGTLNLALSQGQPLVVGTSAATLVVSPDAAQPEFGRLSLRFEQAEFALDEGVGGGIGGLLDYRDNSLVNSKAFIDELAAKIADEMNTVLAAGTDRAGATPTQDLFQYDPLNPAGTLKVTDGFTADKLAFGQDGTPGDNSNLQQLVALADKTLTFTSLGMEATLGDAFASKLGELGSRSQQAKLDADSALQSQRRAQGEWAGVSGVNLDEEGASLILYQQAYQANAKVISTADQLFKSVLQAF